MVVQPPPARERKSLELKAFLILAVLLAPILTVTSIGGYGLAIWMYQMVAGPPAYSAKATQIRLPSKQTSQ